MKLLILIVILAALTGCAAPETMPEYYQQLAARNAEMERAAYTDRLQQQLLAEWQLRLEIERERTKQAAVHATIPPVQAFEPAPTVASFPHLEKIMDACLAEQESAKSETPPNDICDAIDKELKDLKKRAGIVSAPPVPASSGTTVNVIGSTVTGSPLFSTGSTVTGETHRAGPPRAAPQTQRVVPPMLVPPETTGQTVAKSISSVFNNLIDTSGKVIMSPTGTAVAVGAASIGLVNAATDRATTEIGGNYGYTGNDDNTGRYDHNTKVTEYAEGE